MTTASAEVSEKPTLVKKEIKANEIEMPHQCRRH